MTSQQWNDMSEAERADHLQEHDIEYRSRQLSGIGALFGSAGSAKTYWQAIIGGVVMSRWLPSKQDCAREAVDNLAYILGKTKQPK